MSQQLRRGAGQVLDDIHKRLRCLIQAIDDPTIQSDIVDLKIIIDDEIKPMLYRASTAEPTQDARLRALEAKVEDMAGLLSTLLQMNGQHL